MKVHNTLSGQKEEFSPLGDEVRMYVCGVTPYDACHIGHAMSYITFDVIRRYLEFRGYEVKHVQNFTDIDDKIIARANKLGIPPQDLAGRFIADYFEEMDALNITRAHVYPRATEEIPAIIEAVDGLVQKGYAYEAKGDVYFRVRSDPDYGKLSHRSLEGMMAGARIEVEEAKEHPLDFALWKAAKQGEPSWPSPWGPGRPGWHIECSVMSLKYLGQTLDIHGGGQDLIFPHHENEIAQSECLTGAPFVRYWLHNALLQLGADKMSKSAGNLITVKEALSRYSSDAIRLFVLNSHYRSPIAYSEERLEAMERAADRLRRAVQGDKGASAIPIDLGPFQDRFIEAMDDDFNTPRAIAVLFDLVAEINIAREQGLDISQAQQGLLDLAGVLGLTLKEPEQHLEPMPFTQLLTEVHAELDRVDPSLAVAAGGFEIEPSPETGAEFIIASLLRVREELRARKRWDLADWLRSRLGELGISLEDTPEGTVWRYGRH